MLNKNHNFLINRGDNSKGTTLLFTG